MCVLSTLYLILIYCGEPIGFGGHITNDFSDHRVWWAQMNTFFLSLGTIPAWNCIDNYGLGLSHLGGRGMASLYPLNWWLYLPTYYGGEISYLAHYINIFSHILIGMLGIYYTLVKIIKIDKDISLLSSTLFMLNLRFNDFIRYPNGIEAISWIPWIIFFVLKIHTDKSFEKRIYNFNKKEWKTIISLILTVQLSWLAGYGHFTYLGFLIVGTLLIFNFKNIQVFLISLVSLLIGTLLSTGNLLPIYQNLSSRNNGKEKTLEWAVDNSVLSYCEQIFNPYNVDIFRNFITFPGFVILVIISSCILICKVFVNFHFLKRNKLLISFILIFIILLDTSRGQNGYTFTYLFNYLPFFDSFRNPVKNNFLTYIPFCLIFAATVQYLRSKRYSTIICVIGLSSILILCIATNLYLHKYSSFNYQFSPYRLNLINLDFSILTYSLMCLVSVIALYFYIRKKNHFLNLITPIFLCLIFVMCFGRYYTWTENNHNDWELSQNKISNFYPNGILNGLLLTNGKSLESNKNLEGDPILKVLNNNFPQSRFRWFPTDGKSKFEFKLLSFSSGNIHIKSENKSFGRLLYIQSYHNQWESNLPIEPYEFLNKKIISVLVEGSNNISLHFDSSMYKLFSILSLLSSLTFILLLIHFLRLKNLLRKLSTIIVSFIFLIMIYFCQNEAPIDDTLLFGKNVDSHTFSILPCKVSRSNY